MQHANMLVSAYWGCCTAACWQCEHLLTWCGATCGGGLFVHRTTPFGSCRPTRRWPHAKSAIAVIFCKTNTKSIEKIRNAPIWCILNENGSHLSWVAGIVTGSNAKIVYRAFCSKCLILNKKLFLLSWVAGVAGVYLIYFLFFEK